MAFTRPYITDKLISYEGDKRFTHLSLAIWLIDDSTGKEPVGSVKVTAKKDGNKKINGVKNPSGYYIFNDLSDRIYTIGIESDIYLHKERTVDISKIKTLDTVTLEFESSGPLKGETSTQLRNISELQADYIVEFSNPDGETEQRSIREIEDKTIKWKKALKYRFDAPGSTIRALSYLIEIYLEPITP